MNSKFNDVLPAPLIFLFRDRGLEVANRGPGTPSRDIADTLTLRNEAQEAEDRRS